MTRFRGLWFAVGCDFDSTFVLLRPYTQRSMPGRIFSIEMPEFYVCVFTALLCLAPDGPVSAEGGSSSTSILDSGMLASGGLSSVNYWRR